MAHNSPWLWTGRPRKLAQYTVFTEARPCGRRSHSASGPAHTAQRRGGRKTWHISSSWEPAWAACRWPTKCASSRAATTRSPSISNNPRFHFVPSNPWVAVNWRTRADIELDIGPSLKRKGIDFVPVGAKRVHPAENRIELDDGSSIAYDYLVIATGPKLAFDEVPGLGPAAAGGHTQSICHVDHAVEAEKGWQEFVKNPGPIVVGAVQGASCYGPAYEFAMIMDTDLRRRKIRDKVPMTFVTAEPYVGHLGLGGVGDSKGLLESAMRERHIKWICNAKTTRVEPGKMFVTEHDEDGKPKKEHELPFSYSMMLPAFKGVDAVFGIEGLTNPRGFILIDEFQRNPKFKNIYSVGVCVAIPPVEVDARAHRRAEDRLHDRIDGDGRRAQHPRRARRQRDRTRRRPGTPCALPTSATPASRSSPCRRSRRATSTGLPRASGCTWPRSASRSTSCAR